MVKILVHLTHSPEHPTRAALAFLVAKSAIDEGHAVSMFLAGDTVQLIRDAALANLQAWAQASCVNGTIRLWRLADVAQHADG